MAKRMHNGMPTAGVFGGDIDPFAPRELTQAGQCDPVAKPGVKLFRSWVIHQWGQHPNVPENIVRPCTKEDGSPNGSPSEHWEGRAWDWMIPNAEMAAGFLATFMATDSLGHPFALARRAGCMLCIYNRSIWRSYAYQGSPNGVWTPYTGASPHTDHIHFSFSWAGARGETSLYPAIAAGSV